MHQKELTSAASTYKQHSTVSWHSGPGVVDSLVSADEVVKSKVVY